MTTKEKVLAFLEENRGTHISGAKIAEVLNVSRNTVWKSIKQLEKEGYDIDAVTNKGYSLAQDSNQMSEVGIRSILNKGFQEAPIYFYDTIDSTNKKAKELAIEGASHGTLVIANEQSAGKGRYGRSFESPKDSGIYMSLILRPEKLSYTHPTLITSYAAVVVSEVVKELTGKVIEIKWVNDLFYQNKKVCGILTEAVTDFESGTMEWIVLGIGLNLLSGVFSDEIAIKAGGIFEGNDIELNRNELVANLYQSLLTEHLEKDELEMMALYKEKSLVLNKEVLLQQGNTEFRAFIKDIDATGQLIIERTPGKEEIFNSGEIRIVLN
ncbi:MULTISPECIES: biotin--[acetyl-CoA-carboxylase] ligase [Vagococcus]|uniref:biotin--[acetyl-CoA-carboxylase] ligase n=1 Tax=Vagococcus TaxID=2737 RepID=UPI002FC92363